MASATLHPVSLIEYLLVTNIV